MAQTVIGIFKDLSDAQKAVERLSGRGISRQQIDISRSEYLDATADREGRNTNRVTDFFNKLFGHKSDDAQRYSTIGQNNVTIVTVHVTSRELAEEAADVLDDCGAVDVDEHASRSGYRGSSTRSEDVNELSSDRSVISKGEHKFDERSDQARGSERRRSRIIDRQIDDEFRLRDSF